MTGRFSQKSIDKAVSALRDDFVQCWVSMFGVRCERELGHRGEHGKDDECPS